MDDDVENSSARVNRVSNSILFTKLGWCAANLWVEQGGKCAVVVSVADCDVRCGAVDCVKVDPCRHCYSSL